MPPVVLCTQQEIHQQDGSSRRGNDHQAVAEEQESEHVVDLVGPEGGHYKVQLDENRTKGENSGQQNRWNCAQATSHRRNLSRNLVRLGRTLKRLLGNEVSHRNVWITGLEFDSTDCLKPNQLPATLNGTLITNQINTSANIVPNGTAPLDPLAQTKRFRMKKVPNIMPGINRGVMIMLRLQESPPNVLYTRADT